MMKAAAAKKILKRVKEYLFNVFFPKRCIHCGKMLDYKSTLSICEGCIAKCITNENPRRDFDVKYYDSALCAAYYKGHTRRAMLRFKFHNMTYLAPTFAHIMLVKLKEDYRFIYSDVITCVPLGNKRLAQRGYNQSDLVARIVEKQLPGLYIDNLLIKVKDLPPISKMTAAKRRRIIRNAYRFNGSFDVKGKTVMLIDDIFTTGATANECARILKKNGAEKVFVMCACETKEKIFKEDFKIEVPGMQYEKNIKV